jgi:hypothetical protein
MYVCSGIEHTNHHEEADMTNRVAVDDDGSMIWVADVETWRDTLEKQGWTATRYGADRWIWEEPQVSEDEDPDRERQPYTEACEAYPGAVEWWGDLEEEEREEMPRFVWQQQYGGWLAPFGPSDQ